MEKPPVELLLRDLALPDSVRADIAVSAGRITGFDAAGFAPAEVDIKLTSYRAYPGLINSHDHLDFNLFPRLGNGTYANYLEWGADIHENEASAAIIHAVLNVPKALRVQWGIYKNLLAGVTTVVHHGEQLQLAKTLIKVVSDSNCLHSIGRERRWRWKLNNPFAAQRTCVIHIGEGTDVFAHKEIDTLLHWNLLRRKLVGIHGVAMNKRQAAHFKSLVWCPDSNFSLLGKTAAIDELKTATQILLGTDSSVSADWNIWNHLRLARSLSMLDDSQIIGAVTTSPAAAWGLAQKGVIKTGYDADIIVVRDKPGEDESEQFFSLNPEDLMLVISRGEIVLLDSSLMSEAKGLDKDAYSKARVAGIDKFVIGNLVSLVHQIRSHYPAAEFPIEVE